MNPGFPALTSEGEKLTIVGKIPDTVYGELFIADTGVQYRRYNGIALIACERQPEGIFLPQAEVEEAAADTAVEDHGIEQTLPDDVDLGDAVEQPDGSEVIEGDGSDFDFDLEPEKVGVPDETQEEVVTELDETILDTPELPDADDEPEDDTL